MFYYLVLDDSGSITGLHAFAEQPDSFPDNYVYAPTMQPDANGACNLTGWTVQDGVAVPPPS
jgi:hypothetical protein